MDGLQGRNGAEGAVATEDLVAPQAGEGYSEAGPFGCFRDIIRVDAIDGRLVHGL